MLVVRWAISLSAITFTHLFKQNFQMTPQEIKAGMTQGDFRIYRVFEEPIKTIPEDGGDPYYHLDYWIFSDDILVGDVGMDTIDRSKGCSSYPRPESKNEMEANAAAICLAVNNTWGMGIDPTKIPSLLDRIERELIDAASLPEWACETLTEILNSAKI